MVQYKDDYEVKGERVREFFALFPVKCATDVRWLEKVIVKEEFRHGSSKGSKWYRVGFVDDEPKLGDTRLRYTFLWSPVKIQGWTRFLCHATISELYSGKKWIKQHWAHYL